MKKQHTRYAAGAALVLFTLLSSCEDLVEVNEPINQISTGQVFESVSTADAALSNLYAEMQAYSLISGGSPGAGAELGAYADDLYGYGVATQNSDFDIFSNTQLPSNTRIKLVWSNAYKEIYMANSIIEGIESSTAISEPDRRRIRGESLFLRSLVYFYLTEVFGDIPYTTTTDYMVNKSLSRTAEAEVLLKIRQDLYDAAAMMEDSYRSTERIYANRKTAEILLATVLMTRQQYAEAETLLKGIVQNPLYIWQPDLTKTFKMTGKHILWQLKPLKPGNPTNEATLYYFVSALPNTYTLSDPLALSFASNDLRKQNWVKSIVIAGKTYYRPDKYRNTVNNTDEYSVVFRLEEAYLLLAEALVQQNKLGEALPYLNAVKQKAGISAAPLTLTKVQLLNEILNENRKEFFTERGIRFLTLKRAGRLNDLSAVKPNWKSWHIHWPVPVSELLLNPNLNPQNDGY
ncbi:RagB/SusD family nutrient uptake outer membrane protein [Chryseobacterium sp.]|uniref:RagB/SusD family nutrient uptake outer membrane protein n=1 Tax=Chryseobacterium sp. TaxID=1871047 RepID=UPI0011CC5EE4|nr:RagB/SusD family nutrient uptake outer membrane protein [Chryseobacterium sp.]TXF78847.1 RagB/SusD family nutrient uptake outer membrane protein [Chryseobacterium sp.]